MPANLRESKQDTDGLRLPSKVHAVYDDAGRLVSYKVRWRELGENGQIRQRSRSFTLAHYDGDPAPALADALDHRAFARPPRRSAKRDPPGFLTLDELHHEWLDYAAKVEQLGARHIAESARHWHDHVAPEIGHLRLGQVVADPGVIVRFADNLAAQGVATETRRKSIGVLNRALRLARRKHPAAVPYELSVPLPRQASGQRNAPPPVTDAVSIERMIEAVSRRTFSDIRSARNVALLSALAHTVATRPSEWTHSATWGHLGEKSIAIAQPEGYAPGQPGLETGARVALVMPVAIRRIRAYQKVLEAKWGPQPANALIFQRLDKDTDEPLFDDRGVPVGWSVDDWRRWTARVYRAARHVALEAPDVKLPDSAPQGDRPSLASVSAYRLRHTAISMALHSTLYEGPAGPDLHRLAANSGHDIQTLQRLYAHPIAEYDGKGKFDLSEHLEQARRHVELNPYVPDH